MQRSRINPPEVPRGRIVRNRKRLPQLCGGVLADDHPTLLQRLVLYKEEQGWGTDVTHYSKRTDDVEGKPAEAA